jgi:hypothetical protein
VISTFGRGAARYAQGLADLDAIVIDIGGAGEAALEAAKRREAGARFAGMALLDEPRVAFGYRHVEEILAQIPDYDLRRLMLDQLLLGTLPINGTRADVLWEPQVALLAPVIAFLGTCDVVLVRSYAEAARLRQWFRAVDPRLPMPPIERVLATVSVPRSVRVRPQQPGVVVWAPDYPAMEASLHLHALAEFHGEVTCVSAGGPRPARTTATFLDPGDPRLLEPLSRAAAIVCADRCDPGAAVAFARLGYGIVAPTTSGAHEFAGDIVTWDALDARFLSTAVAVATTRTPASFLSLVSAKEKTP